MLKFISNLLQINTLLAGKIRSIQAYEEALAFRNAKEHKKAAPLLREAAELGNADAMAVLGSALLLGEGVAENGNEALKWLHKAMDLGQDGAESILGMAYATGKAGVKVDILKATEMLKVAAANGDKQSARMLEMMVKGEGMFRNLKKRR